jgi:TetR/AcrR family transcriptional regulator, mexJK operon transcriptional repressor
MRKAMTDQTLTSRAQKKREQIRAAAQRLFLQHGFVGTSTDAIMAEAGVASKETLYRYYPTKEELFADVLRHLTLENPGNRLTDRTLAAHSEQELRELLTSVAQELLTVMMQPDYLAVIRLLMADLPRFPQLGELFRTTIPERAMQQILALLTQAREEGIVRTDTDLEAVVRMFIGSLLTYALFSGLFRVGETPQMPEPERLAAIVDVLMMALSHK